jgi:hypothetical protein
MSYKSQKKEKVEEKGKNYQCHVYTCDSCYNKFCPGCDNIIECVKCDKTLCKDCTLPYNIKGSGTFMCCECGNGFCYNCEEFFRVNDGDYCKPCAIKLNIDKYR